MTDRPFPGRSGSWPVLALLAALALGGCARASRPMPAARRCDGLASLPSARSVAGGATSPADQAHSARVGAPAAQPAVMVRVNQVGYARGCPKRAFAMASATLLTRTFEALPVGAGSPFRGEVGPPGPGFGSRWPYVYPLDFSALVTPGTYVLQLGRSRSPAFTVGDASSLYRPLVGAALSFFQAQRDGPDVIAGPLHRMPSDLQDAHAIVYRIPRFRTDHLVGGLAPTRTRVDVSGGWFDAGDYLKFTETASFADVAMLVALRDYGGGVPDPSSLRREARFGIDWLMKMWDARRGVLYDQVGLGDGNGHILGDHDVWRLPVSNSRPVSRPSRSYFLYRRPVFAANAPGHRISPNLAGRTAAALGLCAQVFAGQDPGYARRCLTAGEQIYERADTAPRGPLVTAQPYAYYPEVEWHDDMELGGAELYLAVRRLEGAGAPAGHANRYLARAAYWADAYLASPSNGGDSFNLYDDSALGHYELIRILRDPTVRPYARAAGLPVSAGSLLTDMRDQLRMAQRLNGQDPFGLADPAYPVDTVPHALGYAIQARLLDRLTGHDTYEGVATDELDWVLGANPWGSSFVVGAGSLYPHCLAHPIANLSGSLTGRGPILRGATVDGPTSIENLRTLGAPDGFRPCPVDGHDPFAPLTARHIGYRDNAQSFATSEPSDDYVSLALLAGAQEAAG